MYQDAQEFTEAVEGRFGPEEQAEAERFAAEIGMLDLMKADATTESAEAYDEALEQEFQRVESQIGRRLTPDEEESMLRNISTQDQEEGFVPDFVAAYGQQLRGAGYTEEGRVHLGAAAAERAFEEMNPERGAGSPPAVDLRPASTSEDGPAGEGSGASRP